MVVLSAVGRVACGVKCLVALGGAGGVEGLVNQGVSCCCFVQVLDAGILSDKEKLVKGGCWEVIEIREIGT
jgi:hypothetical protein